MDHSPAAKQLKQHWQCKTYAYGPHGAGKIAEGEFKIVAHFPAIHQTDGTEANYLARHKTFRGGLYATYQEGPYKIAEIVWDATNRAGVHMLTMTKYGQVVEFPTAVNIKVAVDAIIAALAANTVISMTQLGLNSVLIVGPKF